MRTNISGIFLCCQRQKNPKNKTPPQTRKRIPENHPECSRLAEFTSVDLCARRLSSLINEKVSQCINDMRTPGNKAPWIKNMQIVLYACTAGCGHGVMQEKEKLNLILLLRALWPCWGLWTVGVFSRNMDHISVVPLVEMKQDHKQKNAKKRQYSVLQSDLFRRFARVFLHLCNATCTALILLNTDMTDL